MTDINQNNTYNEFFENDEIAQIIPHCAVILVVDTSHSMWGKGLRDLRQSFQTFYATLLNEGFLNAMIDIAAVSMGDNLGMLEEFTPFDHSQLPQISIRPKGDTPIGAALTLAIQKIVEQLKYYHEHGYSMATPQLILLSDGMKSSDDYRPAAAAIRHACAAGKLVCRAIAMGNTPDCAVLQEIAGENIVFPQYGDLRNAFATVGKQVTESYEKEAEEIVINRAPQGTVTMDTETTEYLLDGSNIMHWDKARNGISLKYVLAITRELERQGKPYQVYFDATARHLLERDCPQEVAVYEDLIKHHANHFQQVPAGTCADAFLLFLADGHPHRLIMTNDLFNDHASKYPWVKNRGRLLHGMVLGDTIFFPEQSLQFPL